MITGSTLRDGQSIDLISSDATRAFRANIPTNHAIIFVGHSLGGIIARKIILQDPAIARQTRALVTFGTPMGGSSIANWARNIGFRGPVVSELRNSNDGNYIALLARDWNNAQQNFQIPVHCASEGRRTGLDGFGVSFVVDQPSAWLTCSGNLRSFLNHDHFSLSKPIDTNDDLHTWLKNIALLY